MPGERAQANQGVGKRYPKGNIPARKLGKALSRKDNRQNGVRYQASQSRKQQIVVYTDGSVTRDQSE